MTHPSSVTSKKSPNVYKSCPKNDFTRKMKDFDNFTKIALNVGGLGKIIVATGFEKLPKVQKSPDLVTLQSWTLPSANSKTLLAYRNCFITWATLGQD